MNSKIVKGLTWKFLERSSLQFFSLFISIILARLLVPDDYGLIALTTLFISLSNVFIIYGFSSALVQRDDISDVDYSSVFFINIVLSLLLYIALFMLSPLIADFYDVPEFISVFRVLSLAILITPFSNIQTAYLTRNMEFKKLFKATIISTIIASLIAVYMAYNGYGVWALVYQSLITLLLYTILLWLLVEWKPKKLFSFQRIRILLDYGWKILIVGFMDTLYNEIVGLLIGKKYSTSDLAFYTKGQQFPKIVIQNINSTVDQVIFPALSRVQNDLASLKNLAKKFIVNTYFLVSPVAFGLIIISDSLIELLLTDKWLYAATFMRLACIYYLMTPITTANLQAIKAIGRSDLLLKLNIIKIFLSIVSLLILINFGIIGLAMSMNVSSFLSIIVILSFNKRIIGYGLFEQFADIVPSIFYSACMFSTVLFKFLNLSSALTMIIQIITSVIIYIGLNFVFKSSTFQEIIAFSKNLIQKKIK